MHFEAYQNVFYDWSIDPSKLPSQHTKKSLFLKHFKKCNKLKKRHNNFKIKKYDITLRILKFQINFCENLNWSICIIGLVMAFKL
jgi:hypothetical protein